jgi:hypothetical protein
VIARISLGIVLLAASAAAAAQTPLPAGYPDLVGPRALALSASTGIAAGNEGIYVNPAAMASRKRYSVELGGFVDRRGADSTARFYGASVLDSMTSEAVAAAISFVRSDEGPYQGNAWNGAVGGRIAQGLYLGLGGKYLSLKGPENLSAATVDVGMFWQVADSLSIGAAGYNLVDIGNPLVAPMGVGAGIRFGSDRSFQLTGDWRADFDRVTTSSGAPKTTNRWAVGAEVLLGQLIPVRAGWMRDETLGGSWWSAGAGIITRGGVAFDVGYRQSLDDQSARMIAGSLKVFLFQ